MIDLNIKSELFKQSLKSEKPSKDAFKRTPENELKADETKVSAHSSVQNASHECAGSVDAQVFKHSPEKIVSSVPEEVTASLQYASCVPSALKSALGTASHGDGIGRLQKRKQRPPKTVRISEDAEKKLEAMAEALNVKPHKLAKMILEAGIFQKELTAPVSPAQLDALGDVLYKWVAEHSRQGNNINQIALALNTVLLKGGIPSVPTDKFEELKARHRMIGAALDRLIDWVNSLNGPFTISEERSV